MKQLLRLGALPVILLFVAATTPSNAQDDIWLSQPQVRSYSRIYSFLDATLQDMAAIQAASTTIDPNTANAYSIDALQQSLQASLQFNKLNGILDATQTQFFTAQAAAQNQFLTQQSSLVAQVQVALEAITTAQSAVPAGQTPTSAQATAISTAITNYTNLVSQLSSVNKLITLSTPSGLSSTTPTQPSAPTSLAGTSSLQLPQTNSPSFPPSKKLDNIQQFYWDRLTRLMNTLALPEKYQDANLYFVSFNPSVVRGYKKANMLETRYEAACMGNPNLDAAPVVIDLFPRDAAVNIASEKWRDKNYGFSAILSFFSIGAAASYNQEHLKASQAMAQSSYVSGYGIGRSSFGWLFGKILGEDSIGVGDKPTEALIAVPQSCTAGWTVTPQIVQWIGDHQNTLSHRALAAEHLADASVILTHASDPVTPVPDSGKDTYDELKRLEFDTATYDPTSANPTIVTLTIETLHRFDPQMTVSVDGYLIKRARDTFGRATSGTGTGGILETSALGVNTWIPVSQNRLLLQLDASNYITHFPRIELVSPRVTYNLLTEMRGAQLQIEVDGNQLICGDLRTNGCKNLPPLANQKGTNKNLLVTLAKTGPSPTDVQFIISSPDDLTGAQQTSAAASSTKPALQVLTENNTQFWGAQNSVIAIPLRKSPEFITLQCKPSGVRLLCEMPRSAAGATYYCPELGYLIKVADGAHAGGAMVGSAQLPDQTTAPIQPLLWRVSQPSFQGKDASWNLTVDMVNIKTGDDIQLKNSTGATVLQSEADCQTSAYEPCSVAFSIEVAQFDDVEDTMQLVDKDSPAGHKATIANLHSAIAPLIGTIDLAGKEFYGKNLAFDQLQIGSGTPIKLSCLLPDRGQCDIPTIPQNATGFLYFVTRGKMLAPWNQLTATGLVALKQDALLPPKPPTPAPAGGASTPVAPTTATPKPPAAVPNTVYALQ